MSEPKRGEVWLVDLGMAAKVRPCLVMSVALQESDRALVTLVPHTPSVRSSRFGRPAGLSNGSASLNLPVVGSNSEDANLGCVKVREVIKLLEDDGWQLIRTRGSHRQFRHPLKSGTVTVAGKSGLDVPIGTLGSILKQAGLKKDE